MIWVWRNGNVLSNHEKKTHEKTGRFKYLGAILYKHETLKMKYIT
jgi:hypothetical protein